MRVWFFTRSTGIMTNDWEMMGTTLKATNKPIQNGVEALSMIWTPERKIKCAPFKFARGWPTRQARLRVTAIYCGFRNCVTPCVADYWSRPQICGPLYTALRKFELQVSLVCVAAVWSVSLQSVHTCR